MLRLASLVFASVSFIVAPSLNADNVNDPSQPYDCDTAAVGLYHLDEGTGSLALDACQNGLHGTIHGAAWSDSGKFGKALEFDHGDYVELPDSALFNTDDATFEAWIYMTELTPDPAMLIVDKYGSVLGGGRQLAINAEGRAYALAGIPGQAESFVTYSTSLVPLLKWVHLAAVFDETNGVVKILVNGRVEGTEQMQPGTNTGYRINVGRHRAFDNSHFYGRIDEVRISSLARELQPPVPVEHRTWGQVKALFR